MKSDIYGKGYGDSHIWKRGKTFQADYAEDKGTIYTCMCGANFVHRYDMISNIFNAMEQLMVRKECGLPKTK